MRDLAIRMALGVALLVPALVHAEAPAEVLAISDIHFDPFDDPALVAKLGAAPAEKWSAILEADRSHPVSPPGSDTNYSLLVSAIDAMQKAVPSAQLVTITGDFLAHDYRDRFEHGGAAGLVSYEEFVDRTIAFLALQFDAAFPTALFVNTIGNNDSYCGDYASSPNSPFLAHMAKAWEPPLVNRNGAAPVFAASFASTGHYPRDRSGEHDAVDRGQQRLLVAEVQAVQERLRRLRRTSGSG